MFVLLLLLVAVTAQSPSLQKGSTLKIKKGDKVPIESPGYPEIPPAGTKVTWYLTGDPDTNLLLTCEDLRISPSEGCKDGYFLVYDGDRVDKFCGSESGLTATSKANQMRIEFDVNWSSGIAKCQVRAIGRDDNGVKPPKPDTSTEPDVKVIKLQLGEAYDKMFFKNIQKDTKMRWRFETTPGANINLYCLRVFLGYSCDEGFLKTSGGTNTQKICGNRLYLMVDKSVSNSLNVEINALTRSDGVVNCLVQSVNGPKMHQFMNEVSEEIDSSEYGQKPGVKKTNCECGVSRKSPARIVNGEEVTEGQYPWIVAIKYNGKHWCGGSIITEHHILTAAHCTVNRAVDLFRIVTGTINNTFTKDGQIIRVKRIIENQYDQGKLHLRDISIMLLAEKIKFSHNVGRICLTPNKIPLLNKYITVMGWGNLGPNKQWRLPQLMMRARVRVVDYSACSFIWHRQFDTSDPDRICVWASDRTACYGDSGGPLVWLDPETNRYTQVALVSFGRGCGVEMPQVNTNVAHYYPWIMKIIKETIPSETCNKID